MEKFENRRKCSCLASQGAQPINEACGGCCACIELQMLHAFDNQQAKIDKLEQENKELRWDGAFNEAEERIQKLESELKDNKKQNSYLRGSLNRICADVSNGEHIDKEWIEQTLMSEPRDRIVSLLNSKVARLEAEKKELVEALEFYGLEQNWCDDGTIRRSIRSGDLSRTKVLPGAYIGGKKAREALAKIKSEVRDVQDKKPC